MGTLFREAPTSPAVVESLPGPGPAESGTDLPASPALPGAESGPDLPDAAQWLATGWLAAALVLLVRKATAYQSYVRCLRAGGRAVDDPAVLELRRRMVRNAFALLMCSRGIPMFLAGDEFGNTQFGNNNAYCQDNITSWLDWTLLEKNRDLFRFFQYMIRFRKDHRILRANVSGGCCGFPDVSFHGVTPWREGFEGHEHYVGVMFAGGEQGAGPQVIYVASNAYWEPLEISLPQLPERMGWTLEADTWREAPMAPEKGEGRFVIPPRTVMVFTAR